MNKKLRELLAEIEKKAALAKSFANGENAKMEGATERAEELYIEIDALKKEFELEEKAYATEKFLQIPNEGEESEAKKQAQEAEKATEKGIIIPAKKDSIAEFAKAARMGFDTKLMNEGTTTDGGYTVPEDISTKIEEYKTAKFSLKDLVDVETVSTNKGARTFKTRTQQTGFKKVGEGGKIGAGNTPKFERMEYEIEKYAGYFPVTNELLEDNDADLAETLLKWIADESRVTDNNLIIERFKGKTEVKLEGLDDIKKVINVTLGAAFKESTRIITNDNGLNYLDTLKDEDGRYLLAPNPMDTLQMKISVGGTAIPVVVVPNADLPNYTAENSEATPFIIGDSKEAIKFFDRKMMTIATSDNAQIGELNAFEEDLTIYRAIVREDVRIKDKEAFVNGYMLLGE